MRALALFLAALACGQSTHDLCQPCHGEQVADFKPHPHFAKGLSCDACHGRSEKHIKAVGAAPPDRVAAPDEVPALCGACHPAQHKGYSATTHAKLVQARSKVRAPNCATCHGVHAPRQPKSLCSRCHMEIPKATDPGHGDR